jgi:hypothetical protein
MRVKPVPRPEPDTAIPLAGGQVTVPGDRAAG